MKNIFAYTPTVYPNSYPPYISINQRQDDKYYITVRSVDNVSVEMEIPFMELLKMGGACHSILNLSED